MQSKLKALTVLASMVATFALLPTFGAAAAEPLPDGAYDVAVGTAVHTVQVIDGIPHVADAAGVEWAFAYDDEGRVLDEFHVAVDQMVYEVEVGENGTAYVALGDGELPAVAAPSVEEPEVPEVEQPETTEVEEPEEEQDEDSEAEDEAHGQLVSSVAQCAPSGKVARDAGLPNHGTFVRAAARGEALEFEVDGEVHTADLTTPEGAEAFCALTEELVAAAAADAAAEAEAGDDASEQRGRGNSDNGNGGNGNGNGNGNGRADAPGQQKKNG